MRGGRRVAKPTDRALLRTMVDKT
jgi:ubiquitin-protein ligase